MAKAAAQEQRTDGWENVVFGIGGTRDPSVYTTYLPRARLTDPALEALYVEEHFAARIVEALPEEAMRPGWDLIVPGDPGKASEAREAYAAREAELGVVSEMLEGAFWGRAFGGAVTWIGAEDGRQQDQPLDEVSVRTVRFVHTFDRRDVQIERYYQDPAHPKFQKPELYKIMPRPVLAPGNVANDEVKKFIEGSGLVGGVIVHESRCVVWPGQPTTETRRVELNGWDDSVLERCWEPLKQVGEDFAGKGLLLGRISQMVIKILDLWKLISGKSEETLRKRIGMMNASRSRGRMMVIDTAEDVVNITQPIAGVDALMAFGILRLASAADIPITVLMRIPGDNSDKAGDLELWETRASKWREQVLRPRHERIAQVLMLAKDGPTSGAEADNWTIRYRPGRTPTRKELADIRKVETDRHAVIIDKGLMTAEAIAAQVYTPAAGNDLVQDDAELKAALERRKTLAAQPPKDNAELGTVGARATSAMEVVKEVTTGQIARESGKTLLVELFRFTEEVAEKILGPESFKPAAPAPDPTPGPNPGPPRPGGAGRPPQLPDVDDGGDPRKRGTETEPRE